VKRTKNTRLRVLLFDSTVLRALTYASESWLLRWQDKRYRTCGRKDDSWIITEVRDEIRSSDMRQRSKIKVSVLYAKQSKIRWTGYVMRMNDNRWTRAFSDWIPRGVKRTAGRPSTRWSE
ncbi:hypothetical protein Angca_007431, partial [Angiostrongylus cantonensis]